MCSRYQFTLEQEIMQRFWNAAHAVDPDTPLSSGEIFPKDTAPVLMGRENRVAVHPANWGYTLKDKGGILINARIETATEKRMFQQGLERFRCAIPTSGFYEWSPNKEKHLCRVQSDAVLYLAGLHRIFDGRMQFVILTQDANASMQKIHHRMPVVLRQAEVSHWILDAAKAKHVLRHTPPQLYLQNLEEYQQQSLF